LLEALRRQCLQPLEGLPAGSRTSLRDTLRCWLLHGGDRRATAADLQVHPQTVRYRMGRLRELFGEDLDDPGCRLKLLLALAWEPA
jgi:DNA-binding PucR family transcriptional regulator